MRSQIVVLLAMVAMVSGCSVRAGSGVPIPTGLPKPAPQKPAEPAAKFTFNENDSSKVWQAIQVNTNNAVAEKGSARINLRCTRATTYYRPTCAGGVIENNYLTSFAGDGFLTLFTDFLKMSDDRLKAEGRIFVDCVVTNRVPSCSVTEVQNPNFVPNAN